MRGKGWARGSAQRSRDAVDLSEVNWMVSVIQPMQAIDAVKKSCLGLFSFVVYQWRCNDVAVML